MSQKFLQLIVQTAIFLAIILQLPSQADNLNNEDKKYYFSSSSYGGVGLIQNPTARFNDDGEFLFGISSESPYNRVFSTIQFFPWLEALVRYTEGTNKKYNKGLLQLL